MTLIERSCTIPDIFHQFTGYNQPEKHKHRKREATSMSREVLLAHSQALFTTLHCSFWGRAMWLLMKNDVEQLARSFASYEDLLLTKRARIGVVHSSTKVVRRISVNLTVSYTECCVLPPAFLSFVSEDLKTLDPSTPLELRKFHPTDRRRRYECLQALKGGLDRPLIHMMYAPGSNIRNVHFVWHCTCTSIDEALKMSQPIIEKIKKDISQCHTRAIRREAFQLFGLATPSTKKSVFRHLYKKLVVDWSASANLGQSEIDERVAAMFELEEPSTTMAKRLSLTCFGHMPRSSSKKTWARQLMTTDTQLLYMLWKLFLCMTWGKRWWKYVSLIHLCCQMSGFAFSFLQCA